MQEFYTTERQYVEALQLLVEVNFPAFESVGEHRWPTYKLPWAIWPADIL